MQNRLNFVEGHIKLFRDLPRRHSGFQIDKNRLNRHSGTLEHPCAADATGYAFNGGTLRPVKLCHAQPPSSLSRLEDIGLSVTKSENWAASRPRRMEFAGGSTGVRWWDGGAGCGLERAEILVWRAGFGAESLRGVESPEGVTEEFAR